MIEAGFKYFTQSKLYIWKKHLEKPARADGNKNNMGRQIISSDKEKFRMISQGGLGLNGSKLRDLAWSLDVLDLSKQKDSNV